MGQGLHPLPHQPVEHHAAASPSSVRNGLSQQSQLAMPNLPITSIPLVMLAQLLPRLNWTLNWGLNKKSNTRIKRRVKDKSRQISCLSQKQESSCARKLMEQTVRSKGVQTQLRNGLINLTTAEAQWVKSSLLLISYILSVLLNTLCIIFAVGEEHSQSLFLQFI